MVDNRDWGVVQPFKDIYLSKLSRLVTFHGTIVLRGHKNKNKLIWNKMNIEKSSSINLLQNYRHMNCLKNILKRKNREILGNTQEDENHFAEADTQPVGTFSLQSTCSLNTASFESSMDSLVSPP